VRQGGGCRAAGCGRAAGAAGRRVRQRWGCGRAAGVRAGKSGPEERGQEERELPR
jgi:hypothetical protein